MLPYKPVYFRVNVHIPGCISEIEITTRCRPVYPSRTQSNSSSTVTKMCSGSLKTPVGLGEVIYCDVQLTVHRSGVPRGGDLGFLLSIWVQPVQETPIHQNVIQEKPLNCTAVDSYTTWPTRIIIVVGSFIVAAIFSTSLMEYLGCDIIDSVLLNIRSRVRGRTRTESPRRRSSSSPAPPARPIRMVHFAPKLNTVYEEDHSEGEAEYEEDYNETHSASEDSDLFLSSDVNFDDVFDLPQRTPRAAGQLRK
eukprot:TRINITY_DN3695_c0_g1_i1.p1 TRINITY_DN3695_c0_g1~~TRINITY_DN3695_c0_g1_i1.p1  ORF type:complete len:251 (+),score=34.63 TRINITY_DN3695_c0_g1_i1:889-1641(+)